MNKFLKKSLLVSTALIILGLFVFFYRKENQNTNEIKIGSILILSGQGASWGEAARNGIDMAVEEINSKGGINGKKMSVTYEDDGGDPKRSVSAFQKLTDVDNIKLIIGTSWSITGLPLVNLAKQEKTVIISPSLGVKEFNEANDYLFNTWPHDNILSGKLADYVYKQGYRHVAIFGAKEVWVTDQTNSFKTEFEKLGGKVEFISEPLITDTDTRTDVIKVKNNKKIDAVILTTDGYDLTDITAKNLKQFSVNLPIFSVTLDRKVINDCGAACYGTIFLTFLTPTTDFEKRYKDKYGSEVEIGADSAYDATMMLAQAIKSTNSTDPDIVKEYLSKIKTYDGASGILVSDGRRGFTKDYATKIIKGSPEDLKK